ncbi:MAG: class I SAM-dependent methyltransferase [Bacteroidota bacterium]
MDQLNQQTRARWNALAEANCMHSIPFLDYDIAQAEAYAFRFGILSDVKGKEVLCLASGGGQDSAAFGLLGANITVFDLSDIMLERDQEAARHHGYSVRTVQGDMRDLSGLGDQQFDIIWQSISLNYSPVTAPVFDGVRRLLRPGGIYRVAIENPFSYAMSSDWIGEGYPLKGRYIDGEDITYYRPIWRVDQADGSEKELPTPRLFRHNLSTVQIWRVDQADGSEKELPTPRLFRHNLSTVQNGLAQRGFRLLHLEEWIREGDDPEPGSWIHFTQSAPLFLDMFWEMME